MLTKVKDTLLPLGKQSNVVYRTPCSCGQVYIRETRQAGDKTKGTVRCLPEGGDGEVSCTRASMGESPPYPLGGDHSSGPWQRIDTVSEGRPAGDMQMTP